MGLLQVCELEADVQQEEDAKKEVPCKEINPRFLYGPFVELFAYTSGVCFTLRRTCATGHLWSASFRLMCLMQALEHTRCRSLRRCCSS